MKATGITRKVDELGRIVLPIELRRILNIDEKDSLEIFTEEDTIILRPYLKKCRFCGRSSKDIEQDEFVKLNGEIICRECLTELNDAFK